MLELCLLLTCRRVAQGKIFNDFCPLTKFSVVFLYGTVCTLPCTLNIAEENRFLTMHGICLFVRSLLWAGVQPTLNPSSETSCRSSVLAQERKGIGWCMQVYV